MSFFWSDAEKQEVAVLLRAGYSASKIGAAIGCSRNSVIGVVSRDPVLKKIGLNGRATRSTEPAPKARHVSPTVILRAGKSVARKPLPPKRPDPVEPAPLNLKLHELDSTQCKWPMNDPPKGEPYLFCGHARTGKSYCEYHDRRAVQCP